MAQYVFEAAQKASGIDAVYIATDSQKVRDVCRAFTSNIIMTDEKHASGTDRIAQAIEQIECDYVINIQGDEPLIDPDLISQLAQVLNKGTSEMVSAMHIIHTTQELSSPHAVKVTVDKNGNALYFSRSIIPHHRDEWRTLLDHHTAIPSSLRFFKHIGIYGYSKSFLLHYAHLEQSYLEKVEKLEQLRALEHGHPIKMIETDYVPIGVDVEDDLERVRRILCR
jgi:3-deoxy-manno-octulosonate cytidylyltransferase (CMP-KDO synthetase)